MSSDLSCRARYARHLVREKVAAQLNALQKGNNGQSNTPHLPYPLFGAGQPGIQPWKLPSAPKRHQPQELKRPLDPHDPAEWRVSIIGAGTAGPYIAMILDDLQVPGLKYDLLEASDRVGGRVFAHHFSKTTHDYYDIGAMRFPKVH